jgi:hypothetical protein
MTVEAVNPSFGLGYQVTTVLENQLPFFMIVEPGEKIPDETPNAAMIIGILEDDGLFQAQSKVVSRIEPP